MTPYEASQNLESIRMLMERTGRYSNLSGISCMTAGALALGGAAVCRWRMVSFEQPNPAWKLIAIWAVVLVLAFSQNVVWTFIHARRQGQPVWSHLARMVVLAILPGFFVGGVLTGWAVGQGRYEVLPGIWMLTYGTGVLGAALFAGRTLKVFGLCFLAAGTACLFWRQWGVECMGASFGLFHIAVGTAIACKYHV
jgi:hypothetical protein